METEVEAEVEVGVEVAVGVGVAVAVGVGMAVSAAARAELIDCVDWVAGWAGAVGVARMRGGWLAAAACAG